MTLRSLSPSTSAAYIDLGSNTFQVLVASCPSVSPSSGQTYKKEIPVLLRHAVMANGQLSMEGQRRLRYALGVLERILRRFRPHGIFITATAVFRTYPGLADVLEEVHRRLGAKPQIIDGVTEARLGMIAGRGEFPFLTTAWVMDIGGGSTEFTFFENGQVRFQQSLPLGSTHLAEQFPFLYHPPVTAESARRVGLFLRRHLRRLPPHPQVPLIGIGGYFETLRSLTRHRMVLTATFCRWHQRFLRRPFRHWKQFPIPAFRVPLLPAASLVVNEMVQLQQIDRIWLASFSLREGLWLAHCTGDPLFHRIFPPNAATASATNAGP